MSLIPFRRCAVRAHPIACLSVAAAAISVCATASITHAQNIFFEDFEGYSSFSGNTNAGLPLISEGAKETWYGGRFGTPDGGSIDSDLAVLNLPTVYPNNVKFGQFEDDAGLLFNISTIGVLAPQLSFDWKTHQAETNDRFVCGYFIGNIDFVNDTSDGANNNRVHRFYQDGPTWGGGGWVELLRATNNATWTKSSFMLPANQASIWVAFWLDNGEGDFGKVDNVVVSPAPSAALMGVLGAAVGLRRRRRA